jgi:hypothetical protein
MNCPSDRGAKNNARITGQGSFAKNEKEAERLSQAAEKMCGMRKSGRADIDR